MKLLLITTLYPDPLRPGTRVCHYFAREWVKMGHNVLVVNYRSMFPRIYTDIAGLFPKLAHSYIGSHVEMDRNMNIVPHEVEGIPVYSIPIFKYFPHGPYTQNELKKQVLQLKEILDMRGFVPDAIIGHFHNPQFQIIGALKSNYYPKAKTIVSLHELSPDPIIKCYGEKVEQVLNGVDMIGFRSLPIKKRFETVFGNQRKSFVCWSGTPQYFLSTKSSCKRIFTDEPLENYIYVAQMIKRKYPKEVAEALNEVYGEKEFHLTYVGEQDIAYPETRNYIDNNKISSKFTFAGKIPRDEIISLYDHSHCFILISKDEVFGLVWLEAMARGCITIASKNEGMEGIIHDGVNGFLCKAGDKHELASVIRRINSMSKEEKMNISIAARKTAEELSDYNVAKKYIDAVMSV